MFERVLYLWQDLGALKINFSLYLQDHKPQTTEITNH